MDADIAAGKADEFLKLLISHQPSLAGTNVLINSANAGAIGVGLAALRKSLIEELKKQPD